MAEPQVQPFREFVAPLATDLGRVYLFVHFYNGSLESERIKPGPSETIALSDFISESSQYPEDVVLRIESRGRRTRR